MTADRTRAGAMNADPGTCILLLRSAGPQHVQVGRWGRLDTRPGWYLYVGSAFGPGGVRARVARHWHVDYLRAVTTLDEVWYSDAARRLEHDWTAALAGLRGTGATNGIRRSDGACASHLLRSALPPASPVFAPIGESPAGPLPCGIAA
ncbi:MAG: DUF123 domain-containing protein [Gammaproteobacteria bacterium]|nr:DUF123 domain-containing protein [Gammaproteobacteria bacterium]